MKQLIRRSVLIAASAWALLCTVTVAALLVPTVHAAALRYFSPAYRVGQAMDMHPELYKTSRYTFVIFARSSCMACQLAIPTLADVIHQMPKDVHSVLFYPSAAHHDERAFAEQIGLGSSEIFGLSDAPRVVSIPTVLLVDGAGRIRYTASGAFSPADAASMLASIRQH